MAEAFEGLRTYRVETWGCQMNVHDSEKMAGILSALGLLPAAGESDADVILLNTCSVREKAAHKVFTRLGQLRSHKAARPHAVLGVCGCVAQQERERILKRAPWVDIVLGPRRIAALPDLILEARRGRPSVTVFDPKDNLVPEVDSVHRVSRTRAYVTVMEGCNKNCTFCIVPLTRGRESCRPHQAIVNEVAACVEEGLIEIELLGQNVNAWRDPQERSRDFASLLAAVADVPGVRRLRFTTSHPLHFRDPIIETMASRETICRYLHLPAQSGSDAVLKRMHRGYSRHEYLDRIGRLRARIPDVALSGDIIVGFPGETEEDFRMTLDLVREVEYDGLYSFVYSPRPGTAAESYPDDIPPEEKKARLHRLQATQDEIQTRRNRSWEGRLVEVLVDGPAARPGRQVGGRTRWNHLVNFDGDPSLVGRFVPVRVTAAGSHSLRGIAETP